MAKAAKSKVFVAVGTASGSGATGAKSDLSKQIEGAMVAAIEAAHAKGITDPDKIRAAMLKAREQVKADITKATAKALREQAKKDK